MLNYSINCALHGLSNLCIDQFPHSIIKYLECVLGLLGLCIRGPWGIRNTRSAYSEHSGLCWEYSGYSESVLGVLVVCARRIWSTVLGVRTRIARCTRVYSGYSACVLRALGVRTQSANSEHSWCVLEVLGVLGVRARSAYSECSRCIFEI